MKRSRLALDCLMLASILFLVFPAFQGCTHSQAGSTSGKQSPDPEGSPGQDGIAARTEPEVTIDLYGTDQITMEQVRAKFGGQLDALQKAIQAEDGEAARALEEEIGEGIKSMGDFALVELSRIRYFYPDGTPTFITIDVVDADEAAARMTFAEAPTGQVGGVEDLLAAWGAYEDAGFALMETGKLPQGLPECPAFHCVFGFPGELVTYAERFSKEVPEQRATLERVLREDADAEDRAYAAFLLAHMDDGAALVELMLSAIDDPSSTVRNNALRVLGEVATNHSEVDIPLEPILQALAYPLTTDRNKVLYILSGLAKRPALQDEILDRAGDTLLDILRLQQPNNHNFAFMILREISGEDYPARDYDAWESWVEQRSTAAATESGR